MFFFMLMFWTLLSTVGSEASPLSFSLSRHLPGLTGICAVTHFFAPSLNLAIDISSLRLLLKELYNLLPLYTNPALDVSSV